MLQTDKYNCRLVCRALYAYGVRDVIISPGSRNAPLIAAVCRYGVFRTISVIDERSAAFIALGIAEITSDPVAIICTSGSAMLNYAPALAEAYYHKLPVIAITADRPSYWIGQDDSQTIRQIGALRNVTLAECNIPELNGVGKQYKSFTHQVERDLNSVLTSCLIMRRGPVHINVEIDEPLNGEIEIDDDIIEFQKIETLYPDSRVSVKDARRLAESLNGKNVLIYGGFHQPDSRLSRALSSVGMLPGVIVACEALSNVHGADIFQLTDGAITQMPELPDVLISFGGAPVSRLFKEFVRNNQMEHWHVGANEAVIDMTQQLSMRIEIPAADFFGRFAGAMSHLRNHLNKESSFKNSWKETVKNYFSFLPDLKSLPWCTLSAIGHILSQLPSHTNLQLGNGLSVRYAQAFNLQRFHRVDSNRGVSGIDGCVSTALGAASVYKSGPTAVIVGDMSALYDVGALANLSLCNNLKIIVINNNGGHIFRTIKSTRSFPEMENFLACELPDYLVHSASAFNIDYLAVKGVSDLRESYNLVNRTGNCIIEIFVGKEIQNDIEICGLIN